MSGGRRVLRKAAGAVGGLVGGATGRTIGEGLADFAQTLQRVTSQMKGYVEALNPAVAQQFGTAMKELSATIGESLSPALSVLTDVIRQVADQLAPALQDLAEPLEVLAQIVGDVLISAARILGPLLQALTPILKAVFEGLRTAIQEVIKWLLVFTAYLLKSIGALAALQSLVNAFKPDAGGVRAQAAGTTSIKDLQSISKDLATASANAQGRRPETNEDFIPKIYDALLTAQGDQKTFKDFITEQFTRLIEYIGSLFDEWLRSSGINLPKTKEELADRIKNEAVLARRLFLGQ